jgi:hypothetical protein
MGALNRLDEAAARRWPRGFGYRSSPLSAALGFMVIGVVCLVVGGRAHPVGIGASGAAIGLMVTALRRGGDSQPPRQGRAPSDPHMRTERNDGPDITGYASSILRDETREPHDR